jgi:streptogramin lyase
VLKPGFPTGALALEPDADGNWWLAMMFQAGLAKFDVKTQTFRLFPVQPELNIDTTQQSLLTPSHFQVDGKVWTNDVRKQAVLRLDLASGKYEVIDPFKFTPKGRQHSPYGMVSDAANNLYFMDFGDENVGRIDAKTGQATIYPTPTPHSRPRRTMMDEQGRVWFAEFAADKVGMFDPKREKFAEWDVPTPHTYPYDAFLDRNHELWAGSMSSDRILRFNPDSGKGIEYLLPRPTNIRRVFVDNSTNPVTFWAGNNHGAEIIKLEPLD